MGKDSNTFFGLPAVQCGTATLDDAMFGLEKLGETLRQRIDRQANKAKTNPTEAEKESGRYKKGRMSFHGLRIAIENPKGSVRSGTGEDGKRWETKMHSHYGYVEGTEGNDSDPVDVFIGNEPHSEYVVVINQADPKTKKFDEHKVMLGYTSLAAAKKCYMKNYESGWQGFGDAVPMTMDHFKWWLTKKDKSRPVKMLFEDRDPPKKEKKIVARITMTSRSFITKLSAGLCPGCGTPFKKDEPYSDVTNCEVCEHFGPPRTKKAEQWVYSCCGKTVCDGCSQQSTLVKAAGEKKVPTVAVDLDGTLAKHFDEYDPDSIPPPRPGARLAMEEFKQLGHRVIIFTVRGDEKLVSDWLHEHDIPYDYINKNPDQPEDASDKILADVYIDDRGVDARKGWKTIKKEVGKRIKAEDS